MNKIVTLSALRRGMNSQLWRDSWFLARDGQLIDRPLTLSLVEKAVEWNPESEFAIRHADAGATNIDQWPLIVRPGADRLKQKLADAKAELNKLREEINEMRALRLARQCGFYGVQLEAISVA